MSELGEKGEQLIKLIADIESKTELEAVAAITRDGMRIACSVDATLDTDLYSAASSALVNLGSQMTSNLNHGNINEVIIKGHGGFTLLVSAGPDHVIVASCKNLARLGYYLAFLHRTAAQVGQILGFEVAAARPIVSGLKKLAPKKPAVAAPTPAAQPAAAPAAPAAPAGPSRTQIDKSAILDALSALEGDTTPEAAPAAPAAPVAAAPAAAAAGKGEDMFGITEKDAIMEALKVLGWESGEEEEK